MQPRRKGFRVDRFPVVVTVRPGKVPRSAPVSAPPGLLGKLEVAEGGPCTLHFGQRKATARLRGDPDLEPDQLEVPAPMARRLCLQGSLTTTAYSPRPGRVVLGPLVGLMVAPSRERAMRRGRVDALSRKYARYAEEVGAVLFFFSDGDLNRRRRTVRGYQLRRRKSQWRWVAQRFPLPRVVYDRALGRGGRPWAARLRSQRRRLRLTVLNGPPRITKLGAFRVLRRGRAVKSLLPFTRRLTRASLRSALRAHRDLYLKPNGLSKGRGVYRLRRQGRRWLLQGPPQTGHWRRRLSGRARVMSTVIRRLARRRRYVVQAGLRLVRYLGNRLDFRSLVQKDGHGQWAVSGVVARIAPQHGVVTSPRSGGRVSSVDRVLRHAFPDRWPEVMSNLEQASLRLARQVDRHLGPCAELGLDLGLLQDGRIKVIEVNGLPQRVSLFRLGDPLYAERIDRYPIHYAAYLDVARMQGASL